MEFFSWASADVATSVFVSDAPKKFFAAPCESLYLDVTGHFCRLGRRVGIGEFLQRALFRSCDRTVPSARACGDDAASPLGKSWSISEPGDSDNLLPQHPGPCSGFTAA